MYDRSNDLSCRIPIAAAGSNLDDEVFKFCGPHSGITDVAHNSFPASDEIA